MTRTRSVAAVAALIALGLAVAGCTATTGSATSSSGAAPASTPTAVQSARSGTFTAQIPIGDGRELYLQCAGSGTPTVVLESGIHDSSDTWTISDTSADPVFTEVSKYTHVCIYDRPGTVRYSDPPALTDRSTPTTMPRTLPGMVADLRALLTAAGIDGPYLLVGHSYGGMIARAFAQAYPDSCAGLVFVDAFGPDIARLFGAQWSAYAITLNQPGTALDTQPGWESVDADEAISTIENGPPLPTVPSVVISKTEPFAISPTVPTALAETLESAWPHVQVALVGLEPDTPHVFATGSDHYVQIHAPDLTSSMIRLVLDRARAAAG